MRARHLALLLLLASIPSTAQAIPNFGRREHVSCATCHTHVPRLNRFGYEYRRAGFRMPENLGKEEPPFSFGDFFSGRAQASVDYARTDEGGEPQDSFALQFREFTLYPLTGSWGKYFSSMAELSVSPQDFFEIESAYVRATFGKPEHFGHVRFGVMHPFEGYGASDNPLGISRPLFQRMAANYNQSTYFAPWGQDQIGIEAGYTLRGFSLSAAVFNGTFLRKDEEEIRLFPAQGGAILKTATAPASNYKDVQIFVNQMIGEGVGLSAHYYHGWVDLQKDVQGELGPDNLWRNSFDRVALYAYGQVWKHLALQAGGQVGVDQYYEAAQASIQGRFLSGGAFGEVLVPMNAYLMGALRYDFFDPAGNKDKNEIHAGTAVLNFYMQNGLQAICEYQYRNTAGESGNRQDHLLQLRLVYTL